MLVELMKSKIHCVKCTQAELHYTGSVTIDQNWMDAVGMYPNEKVLIVNNNNGERLETYTIRGERGTGILCMNGAAARKVAPGDELIVIAFCHKDVGEVDFHKPKLIFPQYGEGYSKGAFITLEEIVQREFVNKKMYTSILSEKSLQTEFGKLSLQFGLLVEEIKQFYTNYLNK